MKRSWVEVTPIVGIHGTVKFIVDNGTWLTCHAPHLWVEQFDSFAAFITHDPCLSQVFIL
jgi:hypothetical protein